MSHDSVVQCRKNVQRISKNHMINNLVGAYLRANPSKKRPEEDLKELDSRNKVKTDMNYSDNMVIIKYGS